VRTLRESHTVFVLITSFPWRFVPPCRGRAPRCEYPLWLLAAWAAVAGAAFSAHHFTAIFALTPGALAIGLHAALRRDVRDAIVWRRLALAGGAAAGAGLLAIVPFWWWLTQRGLVAEIAHPTRLPFLAMPEIRERFDPLLREAGWRKAFPLGADAS
jgi:hypothetical protein